MLSFTVDLSTDADSLTPILDILDTAEKIPGNNFLSLCAGDHQNDLVHVDNVDIDPLPIQR